MHRPTAAGRWLERNAKWVVPFAVVAFIGMGVAGLYGFLRWFDGYVRSAPPYRVALQRLRSDREAAQFLGQPIEAEGQIQGNISTANNNSRADFRVPVQGQRRKGTLHISATAVGDDWTLQSVVLHVQEPQRQFVIVEADE